MSLPKSVRNQAKAAADYFENTSEEEAPKQEEAAPAKDDQQSKADPEQSFETEERAKPEDQAKPEEETRDARYWKHRHDVIQGKYNSEVPKLHSQVKQLTSELEEANRKLESAESQQPSATIGDLTEDQIAEFRDTFGEELVDFVTRATRQAAGNTAPDEVENLRKDVETLKNEKLEHQKAEFWTDLETAVPNYLTINQDPAFLRWLGSFNQATGQTFQQDLTDAQNNFDGVGAGKVFKLFLENSAQQSRREIPESEVEPKTSKSTGKPSQGGAQKFWTGDEISKFYRDKAKGKYSKDEASRVEADIHAAIASGRASAR